MIFIDTNNLLMHLGPSFTVVFIVAAIFIPTNFHSSFLISTMAITRLLLAFVLALALATAEELPPVLKGSVTCLDCPKGSHDLSGLQVLVKCDKVKKLAMAYTLEDGSFTAELPSDGGPNPASSSNCLAKIMGGPHQLYISAQNSLVAIANAKEEASGQFTTARSLGFYKSCPAKARCQGKDMGFASSKTVDFPLPREWGLAPSSYYVPFIPIIGIP